MAASLVVKPSAGKVQGVSLHLMPFHLAYSGPAQVSTYFLVKDAMPEAHQLPQDDSQKTVDQDGATLGLPTTEALSGPTPASVPPLSDSQASTLVEDSQASVLGDCCTPPTSDAMQVEKDKVLSLSQSAVKAVQELASKVQKRFAAAFRGRLVQGLNVELPEGYSGFVLGVEGEKVKPLLASAQQVGDKRKRSGEDESTNGAPAAKAKRGAKRSTRSTRKRATESPVTAEAEDDQTEATKAIQDDEQTADVQEEKTSSLEEPSTTRVLLPTGVFSSFVVWNPDRNVDPGSDEYIRSLDEWTRMASLIHAA